MWLQQDFCRWSVTSCLVQSSPAAPALGDPQVPPAACSCSFPFPLSLFTLCAVVSCTPELFSAILNSLPK